MKTSIFSGKSLRLDRLLTVGIGKKFAKLTKNNADLRIPILMYHSISNDIENVRHPYFKTSTSPLVFRDHMKFLHENHYTVISLVEAVEAITRTPEFSTGHSEPRISNRVALTFDDGFADFYTEAFPIMEKYGFRGTVFLPTGFISDEGSFFKDKRCLRWREIRELAKSGIAFGSHTVTHPQLRNLDWSQVLWEIKESRGTIEDRIGEKAESFSYPYAFPAEDESLKERLKNSLIELGYKIGVTTSIGTAVRGDDFLFLRRIPVNSDDDPVFFRAKLEGGYDWIQYIQKGYKILRKL